MVGMVAEMAGVTGLPGDALVGIMGITIAVITTVFAAETEEPATGSAITTGPATDGPTITGDTTVGDPAWPTAKTIAIPATAEGSGNPNFRSIECHTLLSTKPLPFHQGLSFCVPWP